MHKAHIPLHIEAYTAFGSRLCDTGIGGGLLGYAYASSAADKGGEFLEKFHRSETDVSAVDIGEIVAVSGIAEIEHTAHRVNADAVNMINIHKEGCGGEEEALYVSFLIVEDKSAPLGMVRHLFVVALIGWCAVKHTETVGILGEMGGDPVDENTYARLVHTVHKIHKVLRRAVAAGGGEVACHLIAPAGGIGVFRYGHKLNVSIAHIEAIIRKGVCHNAIVGIYFILALFPRAHMHFVDADRAGEEVLFLSGGKIASVAPAESAQIPDLAARARTGLGVEGVGVGFENHLAVLPGYGIFINFSLSDAFNGDCPFTRALAIHRRCAHLPVVELTHKAHGSCVGRPHREAAASVGQKVASEIFVSIKRASLQKFCAQRPGGRKNFFHGSSPFFTK